MCGKYISKYQSYYPVAIFILPLVIASQQNYPVMQYLCKNSKIAFNK